jgi:hypothetical protein
MEFAWDRFWLKQFLIEVERIFFLQPDSQKNSFYRVEGNFSKDKHCRQFRFYRIKTFWTK